MVNRVLVAINKIMALFLGLLSPGGGLVFFGYYKSGLLTIFITLVTLVGATWTGVVFFPTGFLGTSALLVSLHMLPAFAPLFMCIKPDSHWRSRLVYSLAFTITGLGILGLIALKKAEVLGLELFQVHSESMTPTLWPGQLVLADTKPTSLADLAPEDIVFFSLSESSAFIMVKRIENIEAAVTQQPDDQLTSANARNRAPENCLFMLGDNRLGSQDSRHFGCIQGRQVIAKAKLNLSTLTHYP